MARIGSFASGVQPLLGSCRGPMVTSSTCLSVWSILGVVASRRTSSPRSLTGGTSSSSGSLIASAAGGVVRCNAGDIGSSHELLRVRCVVRGWMACVALSPAGSMLTQASAAGVLVYIRNLRPTAKGVCDGCSVSWRSLDWPVCGWPVEMAMGAGPLSLYRCDLSPAAPGLAKFCCAKLGDAGLHVVPAVGDRPCRMVVACEVKMGKQESCDQPAARSPRRVTLESTDAIPS